MQIDAQNREMTVKLVYYGPALSGKTTNLQELHRRISPAARGQLLTLETREDRTLFFDLLPVFFTTGTMKLRLKVYTVPGQVMHNSTRKLVLAGADGVAFVADGRRTETPASNESWANLKANMAASGIDPTTTPIVVQLNKLDLPGSRTPDELTRIAARGDEPIFPAVAIRGEGVVETFVGLMDAVLAGLDRRHQIGRSHGIARAAIMSELRARLAAPSGRAGR